MTTPPGVPTSVDPVLEAMDPDRGRPADAIVTKGLCCNFGEKAIISSIDMRFARGTITALIGPTGSGKSTFLRTINRMNDKVPGFRCSGDVLLDGVELRDLGDDSLRSLMSVVTQELFLFHTTLEENVRYGRPQASDGEVSQAVEAAQLGDLVTQLPDGLQTVVGERGYRLSGGEKQRVAIARAILRNPSVLLLDEATSSLDSQAERLIQEALGRLFLGRTVVAIAHRLSTVLAADQILVVDGGAIVERGRHSELLAQGGLYARLFHEQFDPGTGSGLAAAGS